LTLSDKRLKEMQDTEATIITSRRQKGRG
jgi:hypothetical protein